MSELLDLLADTDSVAGLAITSAAVVVVAVLLRLALVPLARRRFADDPFRHYWAGKLVGYAVGGLALLVIVTLWAPLGGRLSLVLGFATAGIAFAMQEVIGALFGWLNVMLGRIYSVGDRIEIAGVRGDVIDITPLRTKVLEIGSDPGPQGPGPSWIGARQLTGRIVAVSNKKTFTEAVFNYSAGLEWIWEELSVAVSPREDWRRAEHLLLERIRAHDPELRRQGEEELSRLASRYLVSQAEVQPQTFVRLAAGDVEITGRFVTSVRSSRGAKDAILRGLLDDLEREGIPIAYPTYSVELGAPSDGVADGSGPARGPALGPSRGRAARPGLDDRR